MRKPYVSETPHFSAQALATRLALDGKADQYPVKVGDTLVFIIAINLNGMLDWRVRCPGCSKPVRKLYQYQGTLKCRVCHKLWHQPVKRSRLRAALDALR